MLRHLLSCIREYKKYAIASPFFIALEVVFECIIPLVTAKLINQITAGCGMDVITRYGLLLLLLAMASLCCGVLAGRASATASAGFAKNLRHDLFYRVQEFSFSNIDRFSTASLITRLTTDVTNVQMAFMMIVRVAVRAPLMLVFAFAMAYVSGGRLAFLFAGIIPVLAVAFLLIFRTVSPLFHRAFRKYDDLNASVQENIKGIRVVKSFVRADYEKQRFGAASDRLRADFTRAERIVALNAPLMQAAIYTCNLLIAYLGAKLIIRSGGTQLALGNMVSLITYSIQILMSLMMLSMIFIMITLSLESARRITEVLREQSDLVSPENAVTDVPDGSIDFENVSFKYGADARNMALSGIDLHIPAGATVGVIGGTGSGKTSLTQLICRLYDATEGTVRVGGVDVRRYDLEALRNQVAMVLQKNVLFSGTIAENLRWGKADATDDELRQVCRLAQADEFINSFPDGYETHIEQGGANVSGGQRQRLCIARALLKDPKVLILDDSTSAVDTRTDALLRAGLRSTLPDTTKLIIAQRISSVQDADMIVVLDGGRIDDCGTHDELMTRCAIYREVAETQQKAGDDDAA